MQYAAHHGRYSASALLCLKLQAEITYATTAQHAMQHWPSRAHCCTVHLKGNTACTTVMRLISETHPSGTLSNIAKQRAAMREQNNKNFQKPSSRNLACRNVSVSKLRHHQFYIVIISFQFMQSFKALLRGKTHKPTLQGRTSHFSNTAQHPSHCSFALACILDS